MGLRPLPIRIAGWGAVSPAGWGVKPLLHAVRTGTAAVFEETVRTPGAPRVRCARVPKPETMPAFLREPRLRRTSPIAQFSVAAALEALGEDRLAAVKEDGLRLGVIAVVVNGCVNFSRRFYAEVLPNPATASPLIFPETVFNAPSSHVAAVLGTKCQNYTLVGDSAQFLSAFDLASQWLEMDEVDACLIVGAEEFDWLSAEAVALLDRNLGVSEGAAAVYVERSAPSTVALTPPRLISRRQSRAAAAQRTREDCQQLPPDSVVLFDGLAGSARTDAAETAAWKDWRAPRLSLKRLLGEGLGAGTGWQCVAASALLAQGQIDSALVIALGNNQQSGAAYFTR